MPNADGLTDREAAIDAIIRFVNSLDFGDTDMCISSLTDDTVLDLTPFRAAGRQLEAVHGRDKVVETLMSGVGKPLDTTHCATNIRCTVNGDFADLTCCVLAQHFRKGEGPSPDYQEFCQNGNQYVAKIVREGEVWKVSNLVITPAWTLGNPDVMRV